MSKLYALLALAGVLLAAALLASVCDIEADAPKWPDVEAATAETVEPTPDYFRSGDAPQVGIRLGRSWPGQAIQSKKILKGE